MAEHVVLVVDASRLASATKATPDLLAAVQALGTQPPTVAVIALGSGGGLVVPPTPSREVTAIAWPSTVGPVVHGDHQEVIDLIDDLLATQGAVHVVAMTDQRVRADIRDAVGRRVGVAIVDGTELGVAATAVDPGATPDRAADRRPPRPLANPDVMVRLFVRERYGRDHDAFRVPARFWMVSGQAGRMLDEEHGEWLGERRPLQRDDVVGRRFLKVGDHGHAFVLELAADGTLSEHPAFGGGSGWAGSWELVEGFLELTVGRYALTVVGSKDGIHRGLEGDAVFLLAALGDDPPQFGPGRWLKVTEAGHAFVLDVAADASLAERHAFERNGSWAGTWGPPTLRDRMRGRSLGSITIDLYAAELHRGTVPGTVAGDERHPNHPGRTFSQLLVPV